jgi:hypothetical protein
VRVWRKANSVLDPRYGDPELLQVVARSVADGPFRSRVLENGDAVSTVDGRPLPSVELVFLENTENRLYVVLPPRVTDSGLADALRSRTGGDGLAGVDDIDLIDDEEDNVPTPKPPDPIPGVDDGGRDDAFA